jgi:hypothetical protein
MGQLARTDLRTAHFLHSCRLSGRDLIDQADYIAFGDLADVPGTWPSAAAQLEKVLGTVVCRLDRTLIRVSNVRVCQEQRRLAASPRCGHLVIEGSELRFSFKSKSGKRWRAAAWQLSWLRIRASFQCGSEERALDCRSHGRRRWQPQRSFRLCQARQCL